MPLSDEKLRAIKTAKLEFIKDCSGLADTLEQMLSESSRLVTFYDNNYAPDLDPDNSEEALTNADFQVFRFSQAEFETWILMVKSILAQSKTTIIENQDYQQINSRIQ
jgi:hypothetical protein